MLPWCVVLTVVEKRDVVIEIRERKRTCRSWSEAQWRGLTESVSKGSGRQQEVVGGLDGILYHGDDV